MRALVRNCAAGCSVLMALALFAVLAGCASTSAVSNSPGTVSINTGDARTAEPTLTSAPEPDTRKRRPIASANRTAVQDDNRRLVAEGALFLIGAEVLTVKGRTFPNDCTGLVRAAYWCAGIDLAKDFDKYTGNGVTRIYKTLETAGLLYTTDLPQPGDIVFWDNTYDRNEDGEWNDPLTHVGVVVSAGGARQIEYVHYNYRKGIITEYMNLKEPDTVTKKVGTNTVTVNSAMRMKGQIVNSKWLSSHLLREFGKGYLLQ